jgi:hypothetical protein
LSFRASAAPLVIPSERSESRNRDRPDRGSGDVGWTGPCAAAQRQIHAETRSTRRPARDDAIRSRSGSATAGTRTLRMTRTQPDPWREELGPAPSNDSSIVNGEEPSSDVRRPTPRGADPWHPPDPGHPGPRRWVGGRRRSQQALWRRGSRGALCRRPDLDPDALRVSAPPRDQRLPNSRSSLAPLPGRSRFLDFGPSALRSE